MKTKFFDFMKRLNDACDNSVVYLFAALIGMAVFPSTYFAYAPDDQVTIYFKYLEMVWTGVIIGLEIYMVIHFILWSTSAVIELVVRNKEHKTMQQEEWEFLQLAAGAVEAMPKDRQEHYWKLLWDAMEYDHPIGPKDKKTGLTPAKN